MNEVDNETMNAKETIALIEAFRIINETLKDPKKLDEAFVRVQDKMEKGATKQTDKTTGST